MSFTVSFQLWQILLVTLFVGAGVRLGWWFGGNVADSINLLLLHWIQWKRQRRAKHQHGGE